MNQLTIFNNEEFGTIRAIERARSSEHVGFIYVLEWDDAVKIGCTMYPCRRLKELKRQAERYGNVSLNRFAISKEHTNYRENERKMHEHFAKYRRGNTEIFYITMKEIEVKFPKHIEFLDKSDEIEKECNKTFNFLKSLVMGI